jgi:hypothetical protein
MLYWAEGSKTRNVAALTNSDPEVLRLYLRFLRECHSVADEKVALTVHCYVTNGLSADEIVRWCSASSACPLRALAPRW